MEFLWALAACAALNGGMRLAAPPPPPLNPQFITGENDILSAAGFLSLGMRRDAADLGFIRLILYYGTPQVGLPENVVENGGGSYTEILPRAQRILNLDPHFDYAVIYAAGSLAFNLNRTNEAVELLNQAIALNPANIRFRALLAAVGVRNRKNRADAERILGFLAPVLASKDCPTFIKSMAAFLNAQIGRTQAAIALYQDIAATTTDDGYRLLAQRNIKELRAR
ncbi:MAG TPA: tetratricopeptide repeat protein [Elusimicrobiota bacterium]|nr:tetratricopeptide repeat protein [Elusimicrobiota bacterium]